MKPGRSIELRAPTKRGERLQLEDLVHIIGKYREGLLDGTMVTLELAGIVWLVGLSLGTMLGLLTARLRGFAESAVKAGTFVVTSIPVLALLFWCHYPLQAFFRIVVDPFYTAAILLSILNALAVAAVVHNAVVTFPREYLVAARVCGIKPRHAFLRIQLPLILRQVFPALLQLQVVTLHATLFASLISVDELFRVTQRINAVEYQPIPIYSALALFFLVLCAPMNALAIVLGRRYARSIAEI